MTAKEYLNQAYWLDRRINSKLEQLSSLRDMATITTSIMSDDVVSRTRNVHSMQDVIAKIIDMDKKARDLTDEAQRSKISYENEILKKKEKIKNDYLDRAKERIEINKQTAQKKADTQLKEIEEKNDSVIRKLNSSYSENGDKWVDEIVKRVVGE